MKTTVEAHRDLVLAARQFNAALLRAYTPSAAAMFEFAARYGLVVAQHRGAITANERRFLLAVRLASIRSWRDATIKRLGGDEA